MKYPVDKKYYTSRKEELMQGYDAAAKSWGPAIFGEYGEISAYRMLQEARQAFEALIPKIPYIGGDENRYTPSLINGARCLALYQGMQKYGRTAEDTGKVLYDTILAQLGKPKPKAPKAPKPTPKQIKERREQGAALSQERRYPGDYVYEIVTGDGKKFDYGFNFTECATQKFYHAQGADEFMKFYCYLDYPTSKVAGECLTRTKTRGLGHDICNHRVKEHGETIAPWPPPFLKKR